MIQVTGTRKDDFKDVVALINHVFSKCFSRENDPFRMHEIFSDLLCEGNMEHMRIVKADGKPVSVVNYIINDIDINGCVIKAANIGAVCTHEDYRCNGYANLILKDCLAKMRGEGVDFLYVSGEIGLYTKNNIHITGKMYSFIVDGDFQPGHMGPVNNTLEVKECGQKDFHLLHPIYEAEKVKYIRSRQRFVDLAKRAPGPSVFSHAAKVFIVEEGRQVQGYFISAAVPLKNRGFRMEVIEYAGNRKSVVAGIIKILEQLKPTGISCYTTWFDAEMISALDEYGLKTETLCYPGTMRIINLPQLMKKLKPLREGGKILENLDFSESGDGYAVRSGNMELVVDNDKTMHDLVLGNGIQVPETEHIHGDGTLFGMLETMLPVPVPYPYNLNYI